MQDGLISSVLIGTFGSRPTQRGVRSRTVGRNTITNNESMTFTKSFICTADAGTEYVINNRFEMPFLECNICNAYILITCILGNMYFKFVVTIIF